MIAKVIEDVNGIVTTIAAAIEQQSATTAEITKNLSESSQGMNEVNENVAQSSESVRSIAEDIAKVNHASDQMLGSSSKSSPVHPNYPAWRNNCGSRWIHSKCKISLM